MPHIYARLLDGHIIEIETADAEQITGVAVGCCGRQCDDPCYEPLRTEDREDEDGEGYPVLFVSAPVELVREWWTEAEFTEAAERGFY